MQRGNWDRSSMGGYHDNYSNMSSGGGQYSDVGGGGGGGMGYDWDYSGGSGSSMRRGEYNEDSYGSQYSGGQMYDSGSRSSYGGQYDTGSGGQYDNSMYNVANLQATMMQMISSMQQQQQQQQQQQVNPMPMVRGGGGLMPDPQVGNYPVISIQNSN